jgi:hypothetical protein
LVCQQLLLDVGNDLFFDVPMYNGLCSALFFGPASLALSF